MTCEDRQKYPTMNKALPQNHLRIFKKQNAFQNSSENFWSHPPVLLPWEEAWKGKPICRLSSGEGDTVICVCLPAPAAKGQLSRVSLRPSLKCCWGDRLKATATPYFFGVARQRPHLGTEVSSQGLGRSNGKKFWKGTHGGHYQWEGCFQSHLTWASSVQPLVSRACLRWGPSSWITKVWVGGAILHIPFIVTLCFWSEKGSRFAAGLHQIWGRWM